LGDGAVGQRGEGEGESDASADHVPCLSGALSCPRIPQGVGFGAKEFGDEVWSLGSGIAILWIDVLEGAIDR
jgi:hypothetical protein